MTGKFNLFGKKKKDIAPDSELYGPAKKIAQQQKEHEAKIQSRPVDAGLANLERRIEQEQKSQQPETHVWVNSYKIPENIRVYNQTDDKVLSLEELHGKPVYAPKKVVINELEYVPDSITTNMNYLPLVILQRDKSLSSGWKRTYGIAYVYKGFKTSKSKDAFEKEIETLQTLRTGINYAPRNVIISKGE